MIYGYIVRGRQLRVGIDFNHLQLRARGDKRIHLWAGICAFYGTLAKMIAAFGASA